MCLSDLNSRVCPIIHLSDMRIRSNTRETSCNALFRAPSSAVMPRDVLEGLNEKARAARAMVTKNGVPLKIAALPCKRAVRPAFQGEPVTPRITLHGSCLGQAILAFMYLVLFLL